MNKTRYFLIVCFLIGFTPVSYGQTVMLKELVKNVFYLGTALNDRQVDGHEPETLQILKNHFNSITAENEMKWSTIGKHPGKYNFKDADDLVVLGEANDMFIVGHTLVWHNQTPDWVFQDSSGNLTDRETLLQRMRDYIHTVVGRYKGRVHGWDVVNEAVKDDGRMRTSKWFNIIGADYVEKAFEYAHEADPGAKLYYNDYSLYFPAKRNGVVRLIRNLQSKGIRVDGIGLQGHWGLDYPEKLEELEASILAFSELGVEVMITELDINVLPLPDKQRGAEITLKYAMQEGLDPYRDVFPDSMQQKLADRYAEFFKLFLKHQDKISRVTIWGIHDGQSWLNYWPIRGRTNHPLLFDRKYQPKPAFYAVAEVIQNPLFKNQTQ
ncbi:endo-1,4-beta-xylanase [bacterium]|nr:endo-1,4-beta-xylanase [bacterium]